MESKLYIISGKSLGSLKIGFSKNPDKRLKQLQTGHPEKLNIIYEHSVDEKNVKILEKLVHRDLGYCKLNGEWFNTTPEIAIASIKDIILRTEEINNLEFRYKNGTALL